MNYKKGTWIIIKNTNNEILFLKKRSNWLWTLPWWKIENWESNIDWAYRELKEETWIKDVKLRLFSCTRSFTNNQYWLETTYIWYVENNVEVLNKEIDIFEWYEFFKLDQLPDLEEIEKYDHVIIGQLKGEVEIKINHDI